MTLTVTRGLIGENKSGLSTATNTARSQVSQTTSQATSIRSANAAVSLGVVRSADAAVPTFRSSRANGLFDKIRNPKEAELLADDVGERIRQEEDGDQAHSGLVHTTAREHFV